MNIQGLEKVSLGEYEELGIGYWSISMKENRVLIVWDVDDEGDKKTIITVKHINAEEAGEAIMYWGPMLDAIQVYRIIRDIVDLYQEHSLPDFIQIIKNMSYLHHSSITYDRELGITYDTELGRRFFEEIKNTFDILEKQTG
ncbi:hypothetical protein JK635_07735 [Neobacillus sp. YIM B02564]|uniref:Uncharacterized protein n=1 Tax=Neobacillus paridis TaxID=2803862 RepID=A0ABS1TLA9_9BACI|nr:hypothetical protein [Neobacillus paridis]MBL4952100.1 hypothetical protein [Neobacillus paridis]